MGETGAETGMAETGRPKTREAPMTMMAESRMTAMSEAAWSGSAMWVRQGGGARRSFRSTGYRQCYQTGNEGTSWEKFFLFSESRPSGESALAR